MLLPKKIFYGLEAVLYIAYNSNHGPISGKELAARQGLPPRYLEQLMQKLVRAGILRGLRGPSGGYLIARERRRITMGDIYDILQDDKNDYSGNSTALGAQIIIPAWHIAQEKMLEALRQTSLEMLCQHAASARIRKEYETATDFVI